MTENNSEINYFDPIKYAEKINKSKIKVISNFLKKITKRYNINDVTMDKVNEIIRKLFCLEFLSEKKPNFYNNKMKIYKRTNNLLCVPNICEEFGINWCVNASYLNILDIADLIPEKMIKFFIGNLKNFHHANSVLCFWEKYIFFPPKEEYIEIFQKRNNFSFFIELIRNLCDNINDAEYDKIMIFLNIISKYFQIINDYSIFCSYFCESYNSYFPNYVLLCAKNKSNMCDDFEHIIKNINLIENKIKLLKLLDEQNIFNEIYDEIREMEKNDIIKEFLSTKEIQFVKIEKFNINLAISFYENNNFVEMYH
jgi:hypothetical protein